MLTRGVDATRRNVERARTPRHRRAAPSQRSPPTLACAVGWSPASQASAMQRPSWGLLRALWLTGVSILRLLLWSLPQDSAGFFCTAPPNISNGSHNGTGARFYALGTVITYTCNANFSLIGAHSISCGMDGDTKRVWKEKPPNCKVVKCKDPVVEHGLILSGFGHSYTYGNTIIFECKTGYFLMGNYLIKCGANSSWYPALPSCKEIDPGLCGAPLIPSGTVRPLRHQYRIGTSVVVTCNKQYSFPDETMEMNVACQGYNSWYPPVQACFFRTSPDIYYLSIRNARIIRGKKTSYEPGDTVTIRCSAGYTLAGPSEIRYIGGKQWSPKLPSCYLTCLLIFLWLPAQSVYAALCSE
ncbi:zona pellucida sperm-binding protein 3 receptor-like isoform X2 [Podarcis raffonei]|uniref:zona pellucida sperm-binding protein 3 receptor-like isoform X2 n=1 Tax=Podarcis raffonei TaxID=65483 RepID=UPI0023290BBA|nr:zona pellucida sperm-binding protein 3 receptor-like isoform X2 [Podarcis raffonei]